MNSAGKDLHANGCILIGTMETLFVLPAQIERLFPLSLNNHLFFFTPCLFFCLRQRRESSEGGRTQESAFGHSRIVVTDRECRLIETFRAKVSLTRARPKVVKNGRLRLRGHTINFL